MFTTLIIAVREFLEVFLIIGVFLGISKKLGLKKEKEIVLAACFGLCLSLMFPITLFIVGERAREILNEKNTDMVEAYLMVFSGFFIAYVVFSLHKFFVLKRSKLILQTHEKLEKKVFDISLFLTIVFFVVREGFEVALFTATTVFFTDLQTNLVGLALGFCIAALCGTATTIAYLKIPIAKIFQVTEYIIIVLGAAFVGNGLIKLLSVYGYFSSLSTFSLPLSFLPNSETLIGHVLYNSIGLEPSLSIVKIAIMASYIVVVKFIFLKKAAKAKIPTR